LLLYRVTGFDVISAMSIIYARQLTHLPGMVAALTPLPVIDVPVQTSTLTGVDSLYNIVQMPRGVPVATEAIGPNFVDESF
jgi:phosphoribosylaminoimidazole carboxylase PurE protein